MQRLSPGASSISSATWNKFADTSKAVIQQPPQTNIKGSRGAAALRVQIENTTGDDIITDFPILRIGQPIYTPADRDTISRTLRVGHIGDLLLLFRYTQAHLLGQ